MANKQLFGSAPRGQTPPATDTINEAGGVAYARGPREALAQLAVTGCLSNTFYVQADDQLGQAVRLAREVDPMFIGKAAVYARERGFMKDMPALLCGVLAARGTQEARDVLKLVFPRVIDSGKMVRNFVQMVRSGQFGRKSLGTLPKRLVTDWLNGRDVTSLFKSSIGNDPSLADVVKMVHPRPASDAHKAFYGYLIGRPHEPGHLPPLVQQFERWKREPGGEVPDVPFLMLTALPLTAAQWTAIALSASWQTIRMNLQTFERHGVLKDESVVRRLAERLRDADAIRRARVFPYQLLIAYKMSQGLPGEIREALQDAMEVSVSNVPAFDGKVVVCPDVSGSMHSPVTGERKGATSVVQCVEVAALVSAAILRTNRGARVIPFAEGVRRVEINPRDTVMTNAERIYREPAGSTDCSAPIRLLNEEGTHADLVVLVSDNQSWIDTAGGYYGAGGTGTAKAWAEFKVRNPRARLVCLDLQPASSTQVKDRSDILNVGGWSDTVWDVIRAFMSGQDHWADVIDRIELTAGKA